jgi:hypothetical protein
MRYVREGGGSERWKWFVVVEGRENEWLEDFYHARQIKLPWRKWLYSVLKGMI